MKKFFYTVMMAIVAVTMLNSCLGNSIEDEYKDWREANDMWFQQQSESDQYTMMIAPWDPSAKVLMRWHNDTNLTRGNLKPLITSVIDTKYKLRLYDNTAIDSSYTLTDSIYRTQLSNSVEGWMIALTRMHVGDSCTVIIPYQQGYGSTQMGDNLLPFSNLVFDIKLVNIYKYKAN